MRTLTMEEAHLVSGGEDVEIKCCSGKFLGIFEVNIDAFSISFDIPATGSPSDPMDYKLQIGPEYQLTEEDDAN